ncbi:MAG TPA: helix-turn-helix domain-containing protein [Acidobacteriaceae bacterium]|nr:helix-turn-helix domain-containing protein [Acidobacteriaceae bacterium]
MGHFGEELRKERMSRGIDLETISGTTKIVTRYLAALENDQFQVLPGGILAKGIVRGYVRAVGLDEQSWVDRFLEASRSQGINNPDNGWIEFANNVKASRPLKDSRADLRLRWMGVCFLLVLLVGVGWFVYSYVSGRPVNGQAPQHAVTTASVTAPLGGSAGH